MIDWQRLLESYGIEHVLGPAENVRAGHIGIACPRCPADAATHFAIDLTSGKVRGCWRDSTHWMSPTDLIVELTGMSYKQAKELLVNDAEMPTGTTPAALLAQMEKDEVVIVQTKKVGIQLPDEFHPFVLRGRGHAETRFWHYLARRGFEDAEALTREFMLLWCNSGDFAQRIIFPICDRNAQLAGWTGRAIAESRNKYKAFPPGNAMESLLWESRRLKRGTPLVVCEGPFDALKIACADHRVTAAALLTNRAGPGKLARIIELGKKASSVTVLLDRGAEAQALDLQSSLAVLKPRLAFVPDPYKDPGDIPIPKLSRFLRSIIP